MLSAVSQICMLASLAGYRHYQASMAKHFGFEKHRLQSVREQLKQLVVLPPDEARPILGLRVP